MRTLIKDATIINEGQTYKGSVLIKDDLIEKIYCANELPEIEGQINIIDAKGLWLIPGVIDDQVHFREPGLTHKGDIFSESKAAAAGGITSYMEMPNCKPQTTTIENLNNKYALGASKSLVNYSFYMGATNDNISEIEKVDPQNVCGIKIFMGSSTGNMLVNDAHTLEQIFKSTPLLIAIHSEDEPTIQANIKYYKEKYGEDIGVEYHPLIRSEEACYKCSARAVELASKFNSRLHILHLSTAKELSLFDKSTPLRDKKITAEACIHHLWFSDKDYAQYGNRIKWNPAIKQESDRLALIDALNSNLIDVIATDHAPHTWEEKQGSCFKAASGGPLAQFSLIAALQLAKQGCFSPEKVIEKMCHAPADLFRVEKRGYIRSGYFADLVLVNPNSPHLVSDKNVYSKCAWTPFDGITFDAKIEKTFVNGQQVYNDGALDETIRGRRLTFDI